MTKELTPEARIDALERRISTLETLLNDVMIQLEKPFKETSPQLAERPQQPKQKQRKPSPPVKKSEIAPSPLAKTEFNNQKQKRASEAALAAALESLKGLLSDGVKRTRKEILEQANLSNRKFIKLREHLKDDGNEDLDKRLYYLEDPNS